MLTEVCFCFFLKSSSFNTKLFACAVKNVYCRLSTSLCRQKYDFSTETCTVLLKCFVIAARLFLFHPQYSSFTGKGFDGTEKLSSKLLEAAERGGCTMEACVYREQHAADEWEQQCVVSSDERICSPPFMELTSACGEDTLQLIEKNGLAFPFICKTRVAHGTNSHEMAIIFNQEGLKAVRPPCVIQSFINHNAVLYKVFVVGESYTVVKRPSLKNFSAGVSDRESIFFNSHNVSKPESSSVLTALDKIEGVFERPNDDVIREISKALRQALGVSLFGIDIIINNQTGQHAVIDINAFPGYEGVSEFFTDLLNHIAAVLQGQVPEVTQLNCSKLLAEQSGGIMDERICCASTGCLSVMGKDSSWIVENETNSSVKLQHQRLGCNSAVSPSFQQHCVATLATKASSQ
uniref:inositol-1,3,4-trisphosphate 5/6-kinase n=1 Tax=Cyanistes caeruleus TaxID=156563 RepID=A0A8C0V882_CYACU